MKGADRNFALVALWCAVGVYLGSVSMERWTLVVAFLLVSSLTATFAFVTVGRGLSGYRKIACALALFVLWRISYFPIMVFSGLATSWAEYLFGRVFTHPIPLYTVFVVVLGAFHYCVARFILTVFFVKRSELGGEGRHRVGLWLLRILGVCGMAMAGTMACLDVGEDLHLLPDRFDSAQLDIPVVSAPKNNPYRQSRNNQERSVRRTLMEFSAAVAYKLIPKTRWGTAVQGTLEQLTVANPTGGVADRVLEHHLAYLAADRMLCHE